MSSTYELLRILTSPVVAITSMRGEEPNGMIVNSAARASLSADKPRLSVYIHKFNYSHETIFESGRFALHLLHRQQMDTVYALGFASRREGDKMHTTPFHRGKLGLPILDDCYAYFECRVVNAMDTGASTLFLGSVEHAGRGPGQDVLTSELMRESMPPDRVEQYHRDLERAQAFSTEMGAHMQPIVWRDLAP